MEKIKVLLVEDEQTLAMIIKDTLEGQGFLIHTAAERTGNAKTKTCADTATCGRTATERAAAGNRTARRTHHSRL